MGYSLEPNTAPNLYSASGVQEITKSVIGDIRDFSNLKKEVEEFRPDLVLHLAAQPLVLEGYRNPRETFDINTQGTANVLQAAFEVGTVQGAVCVTTDKVYKNLENGRPFMESDSLGGTDPYSSSKVAAEAVVRSYQELATVNNGGFPKVVAARGGNIIGGGDWSKDRVVPDFVRSYLSREPLTLRSPGSVRPWQHVIELVEGYMRLLASISSGHPAIGHAYNFGPEAGDATTVSELVGRLNQVFPEVSVQVSTGVLPEAKTLTLDSSLAKKDLNWVPLWDTARSAKETAEWYRDFIMGANAADLIHSQLNCWIDERLGTGETRVRGTL
jgi:CDP-glucose 4,6-dehydratase